MKMLICALTLWSAVILLATAGLDQYAGEPGYVDLGDLRAFEDAPSVTEVIVGENLVKLISGAIGKEDPEVAEMLGGIRLVHVHTLGITESNRDRIAAHMDSLARALAQKGWEPTVRSREGSETVHVYLMPQGDQGLSGLCVLVQEGDEAVFVNIVGDVLLDSLTRVSKQFGIPDLPKLGRRNDAGVPIETAAVAVDETF